MAKDNAAKTDLLLTDNPDRLKEGQRVRHPVFGEGTVLGMDKEAYLISFDSLSTPRSISVTAKLEAL